MKRVTLILVGLCVMSLLAFAYRHNSLSRDRGSAVLATKAVAGAQVPTPAVLAAFVAREMPIGLTQVAVIGGRGATDKEEALPRLQLKVVGKGVASVRNVSLSLFEFDAGGGLRRVDGWIRYVNLTDARGTADVTIDLERRLALNSRLILSVDRVNADSQTWESPFLTLAQATRQVQAGATDVDAQVHRSAIPLPDLAGAALCSYAQGRALLLAQAGDKAGYTSFTCDQNERSYAITFVSKQLAQ